METIIIDMEDENIEEEKLQEPALILSAGGTVAFPTETVYGLGANALDAKAVKKIFEAKGRPSDNPLIVHVAEMQAVRQLVKEIPPMALKVMEVFWPGPLTIVLDKAEIVPKEISGGLSTVAIRMPAHPIALKLIKKAQVPVAAPSANISGRPSPTKASHVVDDLYGKVNAIIKGGNCDVGVESTVLDMTGDIPTILRPGGITMEMLSEILEKVEVDPALNGDVDMAPKSPGMKYIHYAPKAQVYIVKGQREKAADEIKRLLLQYTGEGKRVGIICFDETQYKFDKGIIKKVGSRDNLKEVATNLFKILREFDDTDVDIILAEAVEEKELGQAIMNRLVKAAGYNIIQV